MNHNRLGKLSKDLDRLAKFVLENNKIVRDIYRSPLYNDEPKIFSYAAKYETKYKNVFDIANGFSFNQELALVRVLGEVVERYAINKYKTKIVATTTTHGIKKKGNYLNPVNLSPFSKKQLKQRSFKQFRIGFSSKFSWSEAFSITENKKILIPSQLISFNYDRIKGELLILPPISTGTASGLILKEALYRAICEIVERDAFMIAYLNKLPAKQVDLKSLKDKHINKILEILERYRLELVILDLTTDISIPVFGSIIIDKSGLGPAVSVGLKSGLEIKDCIIGSIEESLMTRSWIRDKFVYLSPKYKNNKIIRTIEQRAYFWFSTKMIKKLNFWLKAQRSRKMMPKNVAKEPLKEILNILKTNNMNVIYMDITPKALKRAGIVVVRVIIPEMQALYLDESLKFINNKRLYDVPIKLGFINKRNNENSLNKVPHPFL